MLRIQRVKMAQQWVLAHARFSRNFNQERFTFDRDTYAIRRLVAPVEWYQQAASRYARRGTAPNGWGVG